MQDESDALAHLRLMLGHLRGFGEGTPPEEVEVRGLVPGDSARAYGTLFGNALRYCWGFTGAEMPEGKTLEDYR